MNRLKRFPLDLEGCAFIHIVKLNLFAFVGNLYQDPDNITNENTLIIYNFSTFQQLRRVDLKDTSDSGLYYSYQHNYLGRHVGKNLYLLNPALPTKAIATLKHSYNVAVCDFPKNVDIICTADEVKYVYLWDPVTFLKLKKIKLQESNLGFCNYSLNYIADKELILTLQRFHIEIVSTKTGKTVYQQDISLKESMNSAHYYLPKTGEVLWVYTKTQATKFMKYNLKVDDKSSSLTLEATNKVTVPFYVDVETLELDDQQILWNTTIPIDRIFRMDPYTFEYKLLEVSRYKERPNYEEKGTVLFVMKKLVFLFEQDVPTVYILDGPRKSQGESHSCNLV